MIVIYLKVKLSFIKLQCDNNIFYLYKSLFLINFLLFKYFKCLLYIYNLKKY